MKVKHAIEFMFRPVVLTLETQQEVDAVFTLFNHALVSNAVGLNTAAKKLAPYNSPGFLDMHEALNALLHKK